MKLYSYSQQGSVFIGAEKNGMLVNITDTVGTNVMSQLITDHQRLLPRAKASIMGDCAFIPFKEVRLLPPVQPSVILCSGLNYKSHVEENPLASLLKVPRFFAKLPHTVIGPNDPIRHPGEEFQVDWEVELGVVFGKESYRINQHQAMDHIFGYTILHDVSSRFIQFMEANETIGKNFISFCPIGPCIVTKDEIEHPEKLRLSLKVNGVIKQDGSNEDWCFPLPRLIEWASMGISLKPGDIISTGTPQGTGYFRQPKEFLQPGDCCELEISQIGRLINTVIADRHPFQPVNDPKLNPLNHAI
ncbi:MAG TPA: fumarylacetoacetate hydrolase family protein [Puia sp.]